MNEERRERIIEQLKKEEKPISGAKLSDQYSVSRQVIVQDIALLRAAGYDIISTNRGYVLNDSQEISRIFKVHHTDEQMEEEMCCIVDLGGVIENVIVQHKVYGRLEAALSVNSRKKVTDFIKDIKSGKSSPLKHLTADAHYHKISADSEQILDLIEDTLREKGFLLDEN